MNVYKTNILSQYDGTLEATWRDTLAVGIANAKKAGFSIVGYVYDEIIALEPEHTMLTVEDLEHCMHEPVMTALIESLGDDLLRKDQRHG
jgi:hypothetical protein